MSKKDYEEVKTVHHMRRLNNSVNGNPAWMVTFDDRTSARTTSDASWSYSAGEWSEGDTFMFTFTPAGRIRWGVKLTEWEVELLRKSVHADYPHSPGVLHDCPACEDNCYCDGDYECIACVEES